MIDWIELILSGLLISFRFYKNRFRVRKARKANKFFFLTKKQKKMQDIENLTSNEKI